MFLCYLLCIWFVFMFSKCVFCHCINQPYWLYELQPKILPQGTYISLGEIKGKASHKPVQRWEATKPFQNSHQADLNMLLNLRMTQLYESWYFLQFYLTWVSALFSSVSPCTSCVLQRSLHSWNMEDVLELPSSCMWFKGSKLPMLPPASYPTHETQGCVTAVIFSSVGPWFIWLNSLCLWFFYLWQLPRLSRILHSSGLLTLSTEPCSPQCLCS